MLNQNVLRGLALAAIAGFFMVQSPALKIGTLGRPGPGLFPILVAGLLLIVSVAVLVRASLVPAVPLDFRIRNIGLVTAALLGFALASLYVNMLLGIVVLVTIASLASDDFTPLRTAAIAVALCAVAYAMKRGLGVQLPLF